MPKKAAAKSAAKCCDMKKSGDKAGKMPFTPFKKGEKPSFKKSGK